MLRWFEFLRSRYALAALAGLMLTTAFPSLGFAGMAWVAPAMILMAASGQTAGRAFRIGYAAGLAHFLSSLYWLLYIPYTGGPIVGWLCLSGYLALFPAVWVWLGWQWFPGFKQSHSLPEAGTHWLDPFLAATWRQRQVWALACAILWVALEMIRSRFLTGFPWNLLGASQFQMLPLIQITSLTGVYGLSFLMIWFAVSLLGTAAMLVHQPTHRWHWLRELMIPLGCLMGVLSFGLHQLAHPIHGERHLKAALVQPSIPQTLIWDANESTNRFHKLLDLSQLALAAKPDLLIWPEGAVPNLLRWDTDLTYPAVTNLVQQAKIWLILCADDAAPHVPARHTNDYDNFNSSFLVSPSGELRATYRKRKLVMFGEYIPALRWFPFLQWFTPVESGFTPGTQPVTFSLPGLEVRTSVLICFEDIFPQLARQAAAPGLDFLVNLTNDGWFGESAAQWQHAANAVFRAVENGLPLVRCTNNGLTCWIDAHGGIHEAHFDASRNIYGPGFKMARIPLSNPTNPPRPTIYHRYGDWFGWGCVVVTILLVGLNMKGISVSWLIQESTKPQETT